MTIEIKKKCHLAAFSTAFIFLFLFDYISPKVLIFKGVSDIMRLYFKLLKYKVIK